MVAVLHPAPRTGCCRCGAPEPGAASVSLPAHVVVFGRIAQRHVVRSPPPREGRVRGL